MKLTDSLREGLSESVRAIYDDLITITPHETGTTAKFTDAEYQMSIAAIKDSGVLMQYADRFSPRDSLWVNNPGNSVLITTFQVLIPALAIGYDPENIHVRMTSAAPETSRLIEESVSKVLPGINFHYENGKEFLGNFLSETDSVAVVYGNDQWALKPKMIDMLKDSVNTTVLELNGKNPFVVSGNYAEAGEHAVHAALPNSGMACQAMSRVYVFYKGIEDFLDAVDGTVKSFNVGEPWDINTDIGPSIFPKDVALQRADEFVRDAYDKGAASIYGGFSNGHVGHEILKINGEEKALIYPIVLVGCNHDMRVMNEEIFAPIIPIQTFVNEFKLLKDLTDTNYGLSASFWGQNGELDPGMDSIFRNMHNNFGTVYLNGSPVSDQFHPLAPMGGYKNSRVVVNPANEFRYPDIKTPWDDGYNRFIHIPEPRYDSHGRHGPSPMINDIGRKKNGSYI